MKAIFMGNDVVVSRFYLRSGRQVEGEIEEYVLGCALMQYHRILNY